MATTSNAAAAHGTRPNGIASSVPGYPPKFPSLASRFDFGRDSTKGEWLHSRRITMLSLIAGKKADGCTQNGRYDEEKHMSHPLRLHAVRLWLRFIGTLVLGSILTFSSIANAGGTELGDVKFTWGGYIKLDTLYSRYSDGQAAQNLGRDAYIPNQIPVNADGTPRSYIDFHAKETRLYLKAETLVEGHQLGGHVEFDFIVNQGAANEITSNAYNAGLRRAFITYDDWLLGQEWTTFQNMTALPDVLDLVNFPTEGTVFIRQPMLRYTLGGFMFAVENPESTIAPNGGGPAFTNTDENNSIPDLIARYNFKLGSKLGGADLSVAGLARQIVDKGALDGGDDQAWGYGLSFAGKVRLGERDDLRFMLNGGDGVGRYLALNTVGDAVIDSEGNLETLRIVNGYLVHHHVWTPKIRSNEGISHFDADVASGNLGGATTKKVSNAFVNLIYAPVKPFWVGAELRYAERETLAGLKGDLWRLQFSAKYSF